MKKTLLSTLALIAISISAQNVGINSTGANPDPSSILDVTSADKGLLISRVNIADLTTIAPITGGATTSLMVYNTNVGTGLGYFYWDGNDWIKLLSGGNFDNGLYFNGAAQRIRLGGPLVEATTITQGTNAMTFNLNSTGDFNVQDNGTTRFQVLDNGRIEMSGTTDASGAANTGVLEIANSLRLDGNEIITNTNDPLFLQNDNNGDLRVDGTTFAVDASTNRVGIGTIAPAEELHVAGDARVDNISGVGNRIVIADANGTLNDVAPGTNGQVLMQTAAGPAFGSSTNLNSATLGAANIQISSGTFANVPSMPILTFTATQTTALLMFTGSGFAYTNSMAFVDFRIWNGGISLGGTSTKMQSYDDVTGTVTSWSCSYTKLITGLTIGTAYTYTLQGRVTGILGTPNAAVFVASNPDTHHLTMSIIQ